jgi:hypothetical protein
MRPQFGWDRFDTECVRRVLLNAIKGVARLVFSDLPNSPPTMFR